MTSIATSIADTVGKRVFLIRLARGDGLKKAEPMDDFAVHATEIADRLFGDDATRFDASTVSRIESGIRRVTIDEAEALAELDPLRRGKVWVAWGEGNTAVDVRQGRRLSAAELAKAKLAAAEAQQRDTARSSNKRH